jgi:uncharacterized membrane protein YesL
MAARTPAVPRDAAGRPIAGHPIPLPSIGSALRGALQDFYFNSWRLAPANLVWAGAMIAVLVAAGLWLPALLLLPVAAVPLAGIHRMAGRLVRGEGAAFSDFTSGMRRYARPALTLGGAGAILAFVFSVNVAVGLQLDNPLGWFLSATALYADVALAVLLVAIWPLLTDPDREGRPLRRVVAQAALVCLARPGRMTLLTAVLAVLLLVSTVVFPAVVLVSVAYVSLVATRYVLPLADRLEGRSTVEQA